MGIIETDIQKDRLDETATKSYVDASSGKVKKYVDEKTKQSILQSWKSPEVVGVVAAITLAKVELPPLFSLEPLVERISAKLGIGRNAAGIFWRLRKRERVARQRDEAFRRRVMNREIPRINSRISAVERRLNRRINAVQQRFARQHRRSRELAGRVPTGRNATFGNTNSFSRVAGHLNHLERRVDALAVALG